MPTPDDDLLRLPDAAALLGLSRSTLSHAIAAGTLPARRIGPKLFVVRRGDVEAYRQRRGDRLGKPGRTPGINPPKRVRQQTGEG